MIDREPDRLAFARERMPNGRVETINFKEQKVLGALRELFPDGTAPDVCIEAGEQQQPPERRMPGLRGAVHANILAEPSAPTLRPASPGRRCLPPRRSGLPLHQLLAALV